MQFEGLSAPGGSKSNEDFFLATPSTAVVVDGATARTETGCIHGVAWFASRLGLTVYRELLEGAGPQAAVRTSITKVADTHRTTCDLKHPGTPSAAIGLIRKTDAVLEWLILGDITLVLRNSSTMDVVTDRHDDIAIAEQTEADRYPIGHPSKAAAMVRMKHIELAARNTPGGFWIASTDPVAADHAKHGQFSVQEPSQALLLSDGAARLAADFKIATWQDVLRTVANHGPAELIRLVRQAEQGDPAGMRWPRNKQSDDATAVYLTVDPALEQP